MMRVTLCIIVARDVVHLVMLLPWHKYHDRANDWHIWQFMLCSDYSDITSFLDAHSDVCKRAEEEGRVVYVPIITKQCEHIWHLVNSQKSSPPRKPRIRKRKSISIEEGTLRVTTIAGTMHSVRHSCLSSISSSLWWSMYDRACLSTVNLPMVHSSSI